MLSKHPTLFSTALLLGFLGVAGSLSGQQAGSVTGHVLDSNPENIG